LISRPLKLDCHLLPQRNVFRCGFQGSSFSATRSICLSFRATQGARMGCSRHNPQNRASPAPLGSPAAANTARTRAPFSEGVSFMKERDTAASANLPAPIKPLEAWIHSPAISSSNASAVFFCQINVGKGVAAQGKSRFSPDLQNLYFIGIACLGVGAFTNP